MYYNNGIYQIIQQLIYTAPAVLIAISVNEFSRAYLSNRLGDPTPKMDGRLTLNPFRHMDLIGTISLLIFHLGWAKPVRVDTSYYKNKKRDMVMVALAGPISNFLTAFIATFFYGLIIKFTGMGGQVFAYLGYLFYYTAVVNVGIGVFNLIPVPPLTGAVVISELGGVKVARFYAQIRRYAPIILVILLVSGTLTYPLNVLDSGILNGFWRIVKGILNISIISNGGGSVI